MRLLFAVLVATGCGGASSKSDASHSDASGQDGGGADFSAVDSQGALPDAGGSVGSDGGAAATSATLSWNVPATYTDGTPLVVVGYHVYYGIASKMYGTPLDVKAVTSYVFKPTSPATYYFAIAAYDSSGSESAPSDEVSKVLQ